MKRDTAIRLACYHFEYKWPESLFTGVMFYLGYRITIEEFNACVKLFKSY